MFELTYKLVESDKIRPVCPYCEQRIDSPIPYFQETPGPAGIGGGERTARLYICPHCNKVLAIGVPD